MDLQDPTSKMSKSADSHAGHDPAARRPGGDRAQVQAGRHRHATTRSASTAAAKPGVSNLLEILGGAAPATTPEDARRRATRSTARSRPTPATPWSSCCARSRRATPSCSTTRPSWPRCCARAPTRPAPSPRSRSSGPTTPSACSPLTRERTISTSKSSADARFRAPECSSRPIGGSSPWRSRRSGSLAVEPLYVLVDTAIVGRLGHRPARRPGPLGHRAGPRGRRLQLPDLRHDRAGGPAPRRRSATAPPTSACRRCGCRRSSASSLALLVSAGADRARPRARRLRRRVRLRRHVPADLRRRAAVRDLVALRPGRPAWRRPTTAHRWSILLASNALNAVLEVVFVFGFHLGVPGSAWSTVIAQVLAAAAFAVVIRRHLRPSPSQAPELDRDAPAAVAGRTCCCAPARCSP